MVSSKVLHLLSYKHCYWREKSVIKLNLAVVGSLNRKEKDHSQEISVSSNSLFPMNGCGVPPHRPTSDEGRGSTWHPFLSPKPMPLRGEKLIQRT